MRGQAAAQHRHIDRGRGDTSIGDTSTGGIDRGRGDTSIGDTSIGGIDRGRGDTSIGDTSIGGIDRGRGDTSIGDTSIGGIDRGRGDTSIGDTSIGGIASAGLGARPQGSRSVAGPSTDDLGQPAAGPSQRGHQPGRLNQAVARAHEPLADR